MDSHDMGRELQTERFLYQQPFTGWKEEVKGGPRLAGVVGDGLAKEFKDAGVLLSAGSGGLEDAAGHQFAA